MATSSPNKTVAVDILSHQAATHPTTIVGSWIDCSTYRKATLFLYHGYVEATADTNPGQFIIEGRPDSGSGSVNEHAIRLVPALVTKGTTPDDETLTASEPGGETVRAVASTSGFAINDLLYIQDTGTLADSEWAELRSLVTNTSLTIISGLTNAKDNADKVFNDASKFVVTLDLEGLSSYRVIWNHEGTTGANSHVKGLAIHHESDNIA
jgi:hypothetical protein